MRNQPYVKKYENGIVVNPITKDNPYLTESRDDKRKFRKSNNRKGPGLVVSKIGILNFVKYRIHKHHLNRKLIVNSILR